ncbi:hypothetical protein BB560_006834 [Smittium megazygosporum]|uniref:SGNH hydrolase-type esterase domain-containing protein n=1 Tax=Smittium megazygosporum TaxID=133381 RepID=A0A2T9Y0A5_9FUNG|nr:hypothetical protein BB560_006934 [Smittium megazygosporum]PVU86019.1 hypothetical protein BB560_006834 [Smittium megazygosporum]
MVLLEISLFVILAQIAFKVEASLQPRLIVFGTGFSDNGNSNITGPIPWWNKHFSNGPVWGEYLSYHNKYTMLDFAIDGATSNNTMVGVYTGAKIRSPSLLDQVSRYKETIKDQYSASDIVNDVVAIEIGANDISNAASKILASRINVSAYLNESISNVMSAAKQLADMGHRNIYFANVPNILDITSLGLLPGIFTKGIKEAITSYNSKLESAVSSFSFPNSDKGNAGVFDTYGLIDVTLSGFYKDLNITTTSSACYVPILWGSRVSACTDSDKYYFVDKSHPSTRIHALMGGAFSEKISDPSFTPSKSSLDSVKNKYNVLSAGSKSNFLYNTKSDSGSGLVIKSYTAKDVANNLKEIYQN